MIPMPLLRGCFYYWKDEWEQRTGAKLNIIGIPANERYQKLIIDLQTGTGQYDGWICRLVVWRFCPHGLDHPH